MTTQHQVSDVIKRFFGRGVCPYQAALTLLLPFRRLILGPGQLADRLQLTPTDRVLELGTGPGFFSPTVAARVSQGRWVGFDLQREMLQLTRRRLDRRKLTAAYAQGHALYLPFVTDSFDVVFLVAVLGEVPNPAACLQACYRVLRPGGRLSITEQPGDPDALTEAAVGALATGAGFTFDASFGRGKNFTLNFHV